MFIEVDNIVFNILTVSKKTTDNKIPIVFLHGFTGCADEWKLFFSQLAQNFIPYSVDLIGHGKTTSPQETKYYSTKQIVKQLNTILEKLNLKKMILVGYSMGGRLALSYTLKYPEEILGLVLESTTAGIEDGNEKKARRLNDKKIAELIIRNGIDKFLEFWLNQPLFETQKIIHKKEYNNLVLSRKKNSAIGLANTLLCFGTGKMPSYWNKLSGIKQNVLLITGSKDKKFTEINKRMSKIIPNCQHIILKETGHNTHLEMPDKFILILNKYLRKIV